ncbi:hypothetical protein KI387_029783, partial [Taxus chinensis]
EERHSWRTAKQAKIERDEGAVLREAWQETLGNDGSQRSVWENNEGEEGRRRKKRWGGRRPTHGGTAKRSGGAGDLAATVAPIEGKERRKTRPQ